MTGDNALPTAQAIAGMELSYGEVKAIASGNLAVLTWACTNVRTAGTRPTARDLMHEVACALRDERHPLRGRRMQPGLDHILQSDGSRSRKKPADAADRSGLMPGAALHLPEAAGRAAVRGRALVRRPRHTPSELALDCSTPHRNG